MILLRMLTLCFYRRFPCMQLDSFQRYEVLWRRRLDRSGTLSGAAEAKAYKCLHISATSDDAGHRILATLIHKPWHISRTPARKKIIADRCFVYNVSNCEATQSTIDIYKGACYDRHMFFISPINAPSASK